MPLLVDDRLLRPGCRGRRRCRAVASDTAGQRRLSRLPQRSRSQARERVVRHGRERLLQRFRRDALGEQLAQEAVEQVPAHDALAPASVDAVTPPLLGGDAREQAPPGQEAGGAALDGEAVGEVGEERERMAQPAAHAPPLGGLEQEVPVVPVRDPDVGGEGVGAGVAVHLVQEAGGEGRPERGGRGGAGEVEGHGAPDRAGSCAGVLQGKAGL